MPLPGGKRVGEKGHRSMACNVLLSEQGSARGKPYKCYLTFNTSPNVAIFNSTIKHRERSTSEEKRVQGRVNPPVCVDSRPAQLARAVNIPRVERRLLANRARTWNSAIFALAPSKLCVQHLKMMRGILLWLASMARFSLPLGRGWTRANSRRGILPLSTPHHHRSCYCHHCFHHRPPPLS